ncbi:MAG: hypothetical protein ABIP89_10725 [Polyangiaceae bacterium]
MKLLRPLILVTLLSCGGKVSTGFSDASVEPDAAASDAGDVDATTDTHCVQLLKQLEPLRNEARSCCPTCNSIQCDQSAEDVCCAISVTGKRLAAAKFVEAVQAFKTECNPRCPDNVCPMVPSQNCSEQAMVCQP